MTTQSALSDPAQDATAATPSSVNFLPTQPTEASPEEVQQLLAKCQAILVDVREPDENARERIFGAFLMPLSTFNPNSVLPHLKLGQKLVFHCRSGRRSAEAIRQAASLVNSGISIINMTGGIEAWKAAKLPLEVSTNVSRISIMRQVQLVIGLCVVIGAALTWFVHPAFVAIPAFFGAGLVFAGASGTCALASIIALMPWNRTMKAAGISSGACSTESCTTGSCS